MSEGHGHHHPRPTSAVELRAQALEALLADRGLVSTDAIDAVVELYENDVRATDGAKVVARAWLDERADYRERLLTDATPAIAELGFGGAEGDNIVVVANTLTVHNMVVCTLCSCYQRPVLGLPPTWSRAPPSPRAVSEPRAVLREFGVELGDDVEIQIVELSSRRRSVVWCPQCGRRPPTAGAMASSRQSSLATA